MLQINKYLKVTISKQTKNSSPIENTNKTNKNNRAPKGRSFTKSILFNSFVAITTDSVTLLEPKNIINIMIFIHEVIKLWFMVNANTIIVLV